MIIIISKSLNLIMITLRISMIRKYFQLECIVEFVTLKSVLFHNVVTDMMMLT
jgi:hypothetical protein